VERSDESGAAALKFHTAASLARIAVGLLKQLVC
jgi:uncharacterized phage protein gp47/JayE